MEGLGPDRFVAGERVEEQPAGPLAAIDLERAVGRADQPDVVHALAR